MKATLHASNSPRLNPVSQQTQPASASTPNAETNPPPAGGTRLPRPRSSTAQKLASFKHLTLSDLSASSSSRSAIPLGSAWMESADILAQHFKHLSLPGMLRSSKGKGVAHDVAPALSDEDYRNAHIALAKRDKLATVKSCHWKDWDYPLQRIKYLLNRSGPILFCWNKPGMQEGESKRHASVITGVDMQAGEIIFLDPDDSNTGHPTESRMSIADFNARRERFSHGMMQRIGALQKYPNRQDPLADKQPDYDTPQARKGNIFYLETPYQSQKNYGADADNPEGMSDQFGCWSSASGMLGNFFEEGPRLGVPTAYTAGSGHTNLHSNHLAALMANENLEAVPESEGSKHFSTDELEALLKEGGPVLFSWEKVRKSDHFTTQHMCVAIGVDKDRQRVIYHDPQEPEPGQRVKNASMTIEQFNIARDTAIRIPLMQRSKETIPDRSRLEEAVSAGSAGSRKHEARKGLFSGKAAFGDLRKHFQ